jgi:hypothetical protein
MPIRINLLADDFNREEVKRKDPVKRAIWIGGFAVFLVLLWALTLFLELFATKMEMSNQRDKWNAMEQKVKRVEDNQRRVVELNKRLSALSQFATNRFLWANVLNALQQTYVENIHLVRLKSEQQYALIEPPKPPPGPLPTAPTASKPVTAAERIIISLDGCDRNPPSAEQIPRFKETILAQPSLAGSLQKTNSVLLTSVSAPQPDLSGKTFFVLFGLQLNFQEKERRLYE